MSFLNDIATQMETLAKAAIAELEKDAIAFAKAELPIIEDAFQHLLNDLGAIATKLVLDLFGVAGNGLSGSEKANLSATQLVEAAAAQGIAVAAQDVTKLIKDSYLAVKEELNKVSATN